MSGRDQTENCKIQKMLQHRPLQADAQPNKAFLNQCYQKIQEQQAQVNYNIFKHTSIALFAKFIGKQYLDNTAHNNKQLKPYNYFNLRLEHEFNLVKIKSIKIGLAVNNLFNNLYEANGYTFSYFYLGQLTTQNYYFPQANINYMLSCNIKF